MRGMTLAVIVALLAPMTISGCWSRGPSGSQQDAESDTTPPPDPVPGANAPYLDDEDWIDEIAVPSDDLPLDFDMAIDGDGHVHLAVFVRDGYGSDLRYFTNSAGVWESEQVVDDTAEGAGGIAVVADAGGSPHVIVILLDNSLVHATNASGVWITSIVDDGIVDPMIDLAIGVDGSLHAIYWHYQPPDGFEIRHATDSSGTWTTDAVALPPDGSLSYGTAIATDESDGLYAAYRACTAAPYG